MEYKKVFINERYADNGEFSHYELIDENGEVLCSEEDKERSNLITVERNSALQSQKDQFEEMDKQIQSLKAAIIQGETWSDNFEITELKAEIIRLKGKVKEAWTAGRNFERTDGQSKSYQEFSKDNQIE